MRAESHRAAAVLAARAQGRAPKVALVLGSGLGPLADLVEDAVAIPYADLAGWPRPAVAGHGGRLVIGAFGGRPVAVLQGRAHYYEHGDAAVMRAPLETLALAGVTTLLLTNAAGSLRPEMGPGAIMAITDHIAWSGANPLVGEAGDGRFVDLVDAYDPALRAALRAAAEAEGVPLHEGVYMWFSGPSFETPAEIRAAKVLGADAVGMSTVPEVVLARRLGLEVAALSAITNLGAGLSREKLSHAHTQAQAEKARAGLTAILRATLRRLP
jgi:purine-nucleoside phosphorylase